MKILSTEEQDKLAKEFVETTSFVNVRTGAEYAPDSPPPMPDLDAEEAGDYDGPLGPEPAQNVTPPAPSGQDHGPA